VPTAAASIVDFHSHFFSRPFFEALARLSPLPGDPAERIAAVARRSGLEPPPATIADHLARWIAEWDRHGVAHAVSFSSLPEETTAVAEAASLSRGRLVPFGIVNPRMDGAADRARDMLAAQGYRGLLLFPAMHHFRVGGPEAAGVLEMADRAGAVVVVHCGLLQVKVRDLFGLPRGIDLGCANPLDLVPAADRYRRIRFVIPHFGAGLLRETLIAGTQCDNLFVDTSSSNSWRATQPEPITLARVFERALGVFGPDRVLFGTDSSTFPRGWRADLLREQEAALAEIGAPPATREKIFGGNARRLLDLPPS
jgi:hypothetical protein